MKNLLFLIGMLVCLPLSAQENIAIGTWRTHFSYYNTRHITDAGGRIYAAAENGLYFFDKADNSLTKISKIDGLQEENISALYYDQSSKQLLIGYQSGNMDVINGQQIINLDLTTTSQVIGSKTINHIKVFQGYAFLSTDFGVLKLDLQSLAVRETYRELGWGAKPVQVNQAAVFNDSLFLATEEGVMAASLVEDVNLLDYQNWKRYTEGIQDGPVSVIANLNDLLIAGINDNGLFKYSGQWTPIDLFAGETYQSATSAGTNLLLVHNHALAQISSTQSATAIQDAMITEVNAALQDSSGKRWIADASHGLVSNFRGSFQTYTPSGPAVNVVPELSSHGDAIYASPGGHSAIAMPPGSDRGFFVYRQGVWNNYRSTSTTHNLPEFKDIVDVAYSEGFKSLFVASASDGLLQITETGEKILIDENTPGSPLENRSSTSNVVIPAIAADAGGLWVLNYGATNPLHFLYNDATWDSYRFSLPQATYPLNILPVNGRAWMTIDPTRGGGIMVFDPESGQSRYLTEATDNGRLPHENVNTLVRDREGLVWVGTDGGVAVFSDPAGVMKGSVNATRPIFENRWLLSGEKVMAIKVDGGNRKWIGTTHGVWLFNGAADEELINFTTNNSPLPDNHILDIEINGETGEVFFATAKGIVSYRGTATVSDNTHDQVKIFPNPVTMDFQGTVGISGLATDAIVKITDASGKLVWQTEANGGTATWRVSDYNGSRVATGIYLVFSASQDGEDAYVGKIAVVN